MSIVGLHGIVFGLIAALWGQAVLPACDVAHFTVDSGAPMTEQVAAPIRVRDVRGAILSEAGAWPSDVRPRFELVPVSGAASQLPLVRADRYGVFHISRVPAGTYCFQAFAPGWQTLTGILVLDPRAPARSLKLTLRLGV